MRPVTYWIFAASTSRRRDLTDRRGSADSGEILPGNAFAKLGRDLCTGSCGEFDLPRHETVSPEDVVAVHSGTAMAVLRCLADAMADIATPDFRHAYFVGSRAALVDQ